MKCSKCKKEIKVDEQYYEIDVYRFNFGVNINYTTEKLICKKCFDNIKWLKEEK